MIVAHLADLHLGHRAYDRSEGGRNVRERDVAAAFQAAVRELIRIQPDLIVVAGDVFDRPDPPPSALVALSRGLEALRASLSETPVLMVAGARDTPRAPADPGALAALDTFPHVEAATGTPRSVLLRDASVHILLLPHRALLREPLPRPRPDGRARYNVLVAHGRLAGGTERGVPVDPEEWSYVALGRDHGVSRPAPNVAYAGSLERVGPGPWREAAEEKGFLTWDLERGRGRFHPVPVRPVVDLAPIRVPPGGAEALEARVREVTREVPGGIEGKLVHLTLRGAAPRDLHGLPPGLLSDLRLRALHLSVQADGAGAGPGSGPPFGERLRSTLAEAGLPAGDAETVARRVEAGDPPLRPRSPFRRVTVNAGALEGLTLGLPPGLVAVTAPAGRTRRLLRQALAGHPEPPGAARVEGGPGARRDASDPLEVLCHGPVDPGLPWPDELEAVVAAGACLLARTRGGAALSEAAAALGGGEGGAPPTPASPPSAGGPEELLAGLRADQAELSGDLEAATVEWLRERQDAETRLQAYRDRARELKDRIERMEGSEDEAPCPLCGRPLGDHRDAVVAALREEWESVVQDGRWWKRRRDQLDPKPRALRELEARVLRLRVEIEEVEDRLDRGLAEPAAPPADADLDGGAGPGVRAALEALGAALRGEAREDLLERTSRVVNALTASAILGVDAGPGGLVLHGPEGPLALPAEEQRAAALLAARAAGLEAALDAGAEAGAVVFGDALDRLDPDAGARAIPLLRELGRRIPQLVVVTRGDVVDGCPEAFDAVLEVAEDGGGRPVARALAAGEGSLVLGSAAEAPLSATGRGGA